jgi:hypothetical protein
LIVPRSDAPIDAGFLDGSEPEPVRLMLDYALVSCRGGCEISVVSDAGVVGVLYEARHKTTESELNRPVGGPAGAHRMRRSRTASMIVIEGKQARTAIQQINASRSVHVFLTTAVHGAASFQFDTSSDTGG